MLASQRFPRGSGRHFEKPFCRAASVAASWQGRGFKVLGGQSQWLREHVGGRDAARKGLWWYRLCAGLHIPGHVSNVIACEGKLVLRYSRFRATSRDRVTRLRQEVAVRAQICSCFSVSNDIAYIILGRVCSLLRESSWRYASLQTSDCWACYTMHLRECCVDAAMWVGCRESSGVWRKNDSRQSRALARPVNERGVVRASTWLFSALHSVSFTPVKWHDTKGCISLWCLTSRETGWESPCHRSLRQWSWQHGYVERPSKGRQANPA